MFYIYKSYFESDLLNIPLMKYPNALLISELLLNDW
jgi:hypothetical protein